MPIVASCPKCEKKYQVKEQSIGKSVRCQACQNVFEVKPAAIAAKRSAAGKAKSDLASQYDAQAKKYGLATMPRSDNWSLPGQEFRRSTKAPDPLANHVVTSPGFPHVSMDHYVDPNLVEEHSIAEGYFKAIEKEERERTPPMTKEAKEMIGYGLVVGCYVAAVCLVMAIHVFYYDEGSIRYAENPPAIYFAQVAIALFSTPSALLPFFVYYRAFRCSNVVEGLLTVFVPFYYFYHTYKYWSEMKYPLFLCLVTGLSSSLAVVAALLIQLLYQYAG